jgi:hypothetical protein
VPDLSSQTASNVVQIFDQSRVHRSSTYALLLLTEVAVVWCASWTLAFHVCLVFRAPAIAAYPVFAAFVGLAAFLMRKAWSVYFRSASWLSLQTLAPLVLGLALAVLSLVASRPHIEDIHLFHRPLVQMGQMFEPFIMHNTQLNEPNLPLYSILHAITSYEMGFGCLAWAVGGDCLWICQHGGQFAASLLLPAVYYLSFGRLGIRGREALACMLCVLLFLLLDGNSTTSFGSVATHLKVGKCILAGILVPVAMLCTLRYLNHPTVQRWMMVALCGVCGVGLSGTAVFLLPSLLFVTSAAYVIAYGVTSRRIRRACLANLASVYCVLIAGLVTSGILPAPADTLYWDTFYGLLRWDQNVFFVL